MHSWHLDILAYLSVAVIAYIFLLIGVRRVVRGDYTPIKVIIGVGLCLCASWKIAEREGITPLLFAVVAFAPVAVGGCWISLWQFIEWRGRMAQRQEKRIGLLEEAQSDD